MNPIIISPDPVKQKKRDRGKNSLLAGPQIPLYGQLLFGVPYFPGNIQSRFLGLLDDALQLL